MAWAIRPGLGVGDGVFVRGWRQALLKAVWFFGGTVMALCTRPPICAFNIQSFAWIGLFRVAERSH